MVNKLCVVLFLLLFSSAYAYSQSGIGAVTDSFKKDYRNVPYPRDNNTNIIDGADLLKRLPKASSPVRFVVNSFEFTGNRVLSKAELNKIVSKYTGKLITFEEINAAADAVTNFYRELGYIISYAYIPPQIIENDIVKIVVVEGEIGDVIIEGQSDYKKDFISKHLESLQTGLVLKLPNLERRLLLLNSYMDLDVKATLRPGKKPGSSDIVISVKDRNPYRISLGFDNYGTEETNLYRFNASAMVGNLLFSGDRLAAYFSMGLDHFNPQELVFGQVDYRLSFGKNGFKAGAYYARSNYKSTGKFEILDLEGYSNEYSIYAEYPVLLKTSVTANLRGEFRIKDSMDKILDERNTADGIYTLSAGVYGSFYPWSGGSAYYSLVLDQGINPLFHGSHNSSGSSRPEAGGLFEKVYGEIDFSQYFLSFLKVNFSFSGQIASEEMFSPEKFYIGGIYSVRGFENGVNSGDNGYRLSLEVQTDIYFPQIKALAFYDRGWVSNYSAGRWGYSQASLDSIGVGLRAYPYKGFALKLDYGLPVGASYAKKDSGTFYARISYDF